MHLEDSMVKYIFLLVIIIIIPPSSWSVNGEWSCEWDQWPTDHTGSAPGHCGLTDAATVVIIIVLVTIIIVRIITKILCSKCNVGFIYPIGSVLKNKKCCNECTTCDKTSLLLFGFASDYVIVKVNQSTNSETAMLLTCDERMITRGILRYIVL